MTIRTRDRAVRTLRLVVIAVTVTVFAAPGGPAPSRHNAVPLVLAGTKPPNCGTPNTPPCVDM